VKREYAWDALTTVSVVEQGPVRAALRITHHYRDSTIEQDMIVYDQAPRIDFVTRADWQARQVMLKAAFPVEVLAPQATYEIQFGAIERPTHHNTSWDAEKFEVCAHRWADLSEAGYGVSLLNDSRYGYDVYGNTLRLSLLRGAEWPDPDADRGNHEFTYALLPHGGDWRAAEVVRRAAELNTPVMCVAIPAGTSKEGRLALSTSYIQVDGPAILDTLKPAEDGLGVIMRLYEPHGGRGRVKVTLPAAWHTATECNMIEEPIASGARGILDGGLEFAIKPFEIKTFRLS
jgi:alpha-mannosidase